MNNSVEHKCQLVIQRIKHYQLDYDIRETPVSTVIFIRKTSYTNQNDKEAAINMSKEKADLKMLDYENADNDKIPCEICNIKNDSAKLITKLHRDLEKKHRENNNLENSINVAICGLEYNFRFKFY